MSEPSEESGTIEEQTLEQALAENFSALSGESEETPSGQGGDETTSEVETEVVAETAEASSEEDPLEPLERWSDEHKEIFRALDRQSQSFLLDRHKEMEGDYTRKTQELSETHKRFERLDEVLKPYDTVLRQQGLDVTPYVGQALQAYFAYQQDPVSTLKALIETSQLTQEQLFEDDLTDPSIRALRNDLQAARNEIANLKRDTSQQIVGDGEAQIKAFSEAKDESGNLLHPYFENVRTLMAPLVSEGKTLEEAYGEAVWSIPDYRKQQLDAERKERQKTEEKESMAKNAEKVKEAKRASDVLPSSDVDKSSGAKAHVNWESSLKETLADMTE